VLLRRQDEPDTFIIIHLRQKLQAAHSRAVFEGTFSEFAAREQQRHEIERRMIESPNAIPGICPVCFAAVTDEGCGGIWSGSIRAKAASGPLEGVETIIVAVPDLAVSASLVAVTVSVPAFDGAA